MPTHATTDTRARAAAIYLALGAVGYAILTLWYFHADFFAYLTGDAPTVWERSGVRVHIQGYLWTSLSPIRLIGAVLAVALLARSAVQLWRGNPMGRILALVTLWGVVLPQMFWFTEFVIDWHAGQDLMLIPATMLLFCIVPTTWLLRGGSALAGWSPLAEGRGRLLGSAILFSWVAFGASVFVDHAYQLTSWSAYYGALAAIGLGALGAFGVVRLRTWGLWAGIASTLAIAAIPLATLDTVYLASGIGQGYLDSLVAATTGCGMCVAITIVAPVAAATALAWPFLRAFARELRNS